MQEFELLKKTRMSINQLNKAKKQMLGSIAIGAENSENLMLTMGKSMLVFDRIDSFEDICDKVESITSEQLQQIANEILDVNQFSSLVFK